MHVCVIKYNALGKKVVTCNPYTGITDLIRPLQLFLIRCAYFDFFLSNNDGNEIPDTHFGKQIP